jgi:thiol-disulfide isomerase/thioredoxin
MNARHTWTVALLLVALAGARAQATTPASAAGTPAPPARAASVHASSHAPGPPIVRATPAEILRRATRPGAHATLVNVWASWCVPCREEFPALLQVARAHRADGLRLVLVSADFDDQIGAAREFLVAHGVTDTCWLKTGDDMTFINTLRPSWSGALPATLIYDANGRPTAFWEGAADSARFEKAVRAALTAGTTP